MGIGTTRRGKRQRLRQTDRTDCNAREICVCARTRPMLLLSHTGLPLPAQGALQWVEGGEGRGEGGTAGVVLLCGVQVLVQEAVPPREKKRERGRKKKGLAGVCHLSGALLYLAFSDKGTSTRARQSNWKPWVAAGSRLGWWRRVLRAKQAKQRNATQRNATCRSQLLAHLGFGRR